tara:strand:+ start:1400 stop:5674 length:4275 start_codon:yes stop_codon:yes gene_type:complete
MPSSRAIISYWNGSAWVDMNISGTTTTAVRGLTINDHLHAPQTAHIKISNQSSNPFSNTGSNSKGPFTGVLGDFTPIKIRDGSSYRVIFSGVVTTTAEEFDQNQGMILRVEATDYLLELKDNTTKGAYNYRVAVGANLYDSVQNTDSKDTEHEWWNGLVSSRGGLIKSFITQNSKNIDHPGDANSSDSRFVESVQKYKQSFVYKLNSRGVKSVLTHIQNLGAEDPHNAVSAGQEFGYDYYLDGNYQEAPSSAEKPQAYFNYFKRGTRPATQPATYGLSIDLPSPDTSSSGGFSTTGQRHLMTSHDITRPKSEIFTGVVLTHVETNIAPNGDTIASSKDSMFELVGVHTVTNGSSFVCTGKNIGGDVAGTDSAEYLKVALTTLTATTTGLTEKTFTVASTAGMYVGQVLETTQSSGSGATEFLTVDSITSSTEVELNRGHDIAPHDVTSATVASPHSSGQTLYARDVARIQYLSDTGTVGASDTAYILLSDIDKNILENDHIWQTGTDSLVWVGQTTTGSNFKLRSRVRNTMGVNRNLNMTVGAESSGDALREKIVAKLQRQTTTQVRADIGTYDSPHFYIDNSPSGVSGTNANLANPYVMTLSSSVNPQSYGLHAGMVVMKLDSNSQPTSTYGYIKEVTSTTVSSYMTGSISASDTLRYYVPVRAGDIVKVRNDLSNLNINMLVTKIKYSEDNGVSSSNYSLVGAETAREGGHEKKNFAAAMADSMSEEVNLPIASPLTQDPNISTDLEFATNGAGKVKWNGSAGSTASGKLYIGDKKYDIAADSTDDATYGLNGDMNADGRLYYVYYIKGESNLRTIQASSYASTVTTGDPEDYKIIAECKYSSGEALFTMRVQVKNFVPNVLEGFATISNNTMTAALSKKGIQPWTSNISFEATGTSGEYNKIKFGQTGSIGSNATLSFSDDDTEAIAHSATGTSSLGNSSSVAAGKVTLAAGTNYIYKSVGDSASSTLVITNDYTDVYKDDRVLLCMVKVASSDDGSDSPSMFPFTGNEATISAGVISAGAITSDTIQANAITAAKITANAVTADKINANAVTAAKLEANLTVSNTIRTASSGARVEITSNGIQVLNAPGSMGSVIRFDDTDGDKFGHLQATTYNSQNTLGVYAAGASNHTLYQVANFGKEIGYSADAEFVANGSIEIHDMGEGDDPSELIFTNGSVQGSLYISGSNLYLKDSSGGALGNLGADIRWGNGDAATPSYSFSSDSDTGMYRGASDQLSFAVGGSAAMHIIGGYIYPTSGYTWSSANTEYINRETGFIRFYSGGANLRMKIGSVNISEASFYISDTVSSTDLPVSATLSGVYSGKYWLKAVTSSARYKSDIQDYTNYIDSSKILDLNVKTYKDLDGNNQAVGLIAEEVSEILPELVSYGPDNSVEGIKGNTLEFLLLEEIKKLNKRVEKLEENK